MAHLRRDRPQPAARRRALASIAYGKARSATIRRDLIDVAARTARLQPHLPAPARGWHCEHEWMNLFAAACGPAALAPNSEPRLGQSRRTGDRPPATPGPRHGPHEPAVGPLRRAQDIGQQVEPPTCWNPFCRQWVGLLGSETSRTTPSRVPGVIPAGRTAAGGR